MTVKVRRRRTVTVEPREQWPTGRGRQTRVAIDAMTRVVIARKGFLANPFYRAGYHRGGGPT